jgi:cytochrome c-type biogenesis protein
MPAAAVGASGEDVSALVYSSSLAAAFLGGIVALFAPCCVVSLLPMFVGAALERGRGQLPMTTGLFAAGLAVVLLPVVLGVGALGQLFAAHHRVVYLLVGAFLVFLGFLAVAGRHWMVPMPELRLRAAGSGPGTVFLLGAAAGVASSCCAPVLAGVVAMSALAASIPGALGLGLAYVFGMVFPLLLAALFWERLRLKERLGLARMPRLRVGPRSIPWTDAVAGAMFLAVGGVALGLAVTGRSTYTPDALAAWNRWAIGAAGDLAAALRGVPIAAQALLLILLAAGLGTAAYSGSRRA